MESVKNQTEKHRVVFNSGTLTCNTVRGTTKNLWMKPTEVRRGFHRPLRGKPEAQGPHVAWWTL